MGKSSFVCIWILLIGPCFARINRGKNRDQEDVVESKARPIWNIAHMANSIPEAHEFIKAGANGIEVDIEFDESGLPVRTKHTGYPCDCSRDCTKEGNFLEYLRFLKSVSDPNSPSFQKHFVMVFMDLKASEFSPQMQAVAGKKLAETLVKHLWDDGKLDLNIRVLFCLYGTPNFIVASGFHHAMYAMNMNSKLKRTGWDTTGYQSIETVASNWKKMNFTCRLWQGDGMTDCFYYSCNRFQEALRYRKENGIDAYMSKVYYWTADEPSTMKNILSLGGDGMITNRPERLLAVLNNSGNAYRLATSDDDLWSVNPNCLENILSPEDTIALVNGPAKNTEDNSLLSILRGYLMPWNRC